MDRLPLSKKHFVTVFKVTAICGYYKPAWIAEIAGGRTIWIVNKFVVAATKKPIATQLR